MTHEQFLCRKVPIKLETTALKAFEGRYKFQFKEGVDSFLDVVAEKNLLRVKEIWSVLPMNSVLSPIMSSMVLKRISPSDLRMDKAGEVSELVAYNTDVWKRMR